MTKQGCRHIGALDTKGAEYAFLKQQIERQGVGTLMIDVGVFGEPPFAPDISAAEVAKAAGADRAALAAANDRGKAVGAMAAGAAIILKRLYDEGRVHGAIAMSGGGGTTLGSIAMQPLPVGAPKLIVSTVASSDTSAYVGVVGHRHDALDRRRRRRQSYLLQNYRQRGGRHRRHGEG